MGIKILFYDDEGELNVDYATYAGHGVDSKGNPGLLLSITEDCKIFFAMEDVDKVIRDLYDSNKYDFTEYGNAIWIDECGVWSDDPDASSGETND